MKNYIKIARPDHWVKNAFIIPGLAIAILLTDFVFSSDVIVRFILGFMATCFIASANYVINEWLDAEFDKYHPTKKYRPVVSENMKLSLVLIEYAVLIVLGIGLSYMVGKMFMLMELWLLIMGVLYNVKPIRTKDIPYLDVLSESINIFSGGSSSRRNSSRPSVFLSDTGLREHFLWQQSALRNTG